MKTIQDPQRRGSKESPIAPFKSFTPIASLALALAIGCSSSSSNQDSKSGWTAAAEVAGSALGASAITCAVQGKCSDFVLRASGIRSDDPDASAPPQPFSAPTPATAAPPPVAVPDEPKLAVLVPAPLAPAHIGVDINAIDTCNEQSILMYPGDSILFVHAGAKYKLRLDDFNKSSGNSEFSLFEGGMEDRVSRMAVRLEELGCQDDSKGFRFLEFKVASFVSASDGGAIRMLFRKNCNPEGKPDATRSTSVRGTAPEAGPESAAPEASEVSDAGSSDASQESG